MIDKCQQAIDAADMTFTRCEAVVSIRWGVSMLAVSDCLS